MPRQDNEEFHKHFAKRARELLRSNFTSLPGLSWGGEGPDPIYGPLSEAVNNAYVRGWIDSEIDFINMLNMLSIMAEDSSCIEELRDIAQKAPKTETAIEYRRDWFEYDYARDQLKLAGIDPSGKRPKPAVPTPAASADTSKRVKKSKRK